MTSLTLPEGLSTVVVVAMCRPFLRWSVRDVGEFFPLIREDLLPGLPTLFGLPGPVGLLVMVECWMVLILGSKRRNEVGRDT